MLIDLEAISVDNQLAQKQHSFDAFSLWYSVVYTTIYVYELYTLVVFNTLQNVNCNQLYHKIVTSLKAGSGVILCFIYSTVGLYSMGDSFMFFLRSAVFLFAYLLILFGIASFVLFTD